ncbi:MAG: cation:proton antiporter [Candidatus Pacebacteria bacterium]|nr:cation:proton antiporter [Candidatus Paceibacterota bacterium]
MQNLFLFISAAFLFTFIFGRILEKIRVPWIFAALIFGLLLAIYNPFNSITDSQTFTFMAELGMYFLLFIVGFEVSLHELKQKERFILKSTFVIIFFEAIFGSLIIHYIFDCSWLVSFLVSLSFASVGEVILIPLLDEFKILKTKLGRAIVDIGVTGNIIEISMLIIVSILISSHNPERIYVTLASLTILFLLTIGFVHFKREGEQFRFMNVDTMFIFSIFILFLFLSIGTYADAAPLAALLAGISLKTFMHQKRLDLVEKEVKAISYGFFAPLFFLWVGMSVSIDALITYPLVILLIVVVTKSVKIIASYFLGKKELGKKESILLGIGLSVRFSTSIIITKILFQEGLIGVELYSVIVSSSIIFNFIVPFLFSSLLVKWKIVNNRGIYELLKSKI